MCSNASFLCGSDERNRHFQFHPTPTYLYTRFPSISTDEESLQSSKSDDTASVFLRLRPATTPKQFEIEDNLLKIWNDVRYHSSDQCIPENQFKFTSIFPMGTTQEEVYNKCVKASINKDENITVLTYGASGSGKTYTLIGDVNEPGIIPRAIEQIFIRHKGQISETPTFKPDLGHFTILSDLEIQQEMQKRQIYFNGTNADNELSFSRTTSVYIWISFFEIYNENVQDLLDLEPKYEMKKKNYLKIMSNSGKPFIKNLSTVLVINNDEAEKLLTIGLNCRLTGSTNINNNSSRSHCIFVVDVIRHDTKSGTSYNTYKFCDLAGSERVKNSETTGYRLKEAQNINTSLLVLGRCLDAVGCNQQKKKRDVIPFRESKLTMFLQSALVGSEKLTMVANIYPKSDFYDENLHVLNYASMAQKIVYLNLTKHRIPHSTRYSFFFGQAATLPSLNISTENGLEIVLDENYRLKEQLNELVEIITENNDTINNYERRLSEREREWEQRERDMRNEFADLLTESLQRKQESCEDRMEKRLEMLRLKHAHVVDELKAKISRRDQTIEELDEEIFSLRAKYESGEDENEDSVNREEGVSNANDDVITID